MHQQPNDRSCANKAIGGAHYGPVQGYMAKVSDAASDPGYDAGWFKVSEMGLPSNNPEYWVSARPQLTHALVDVQIRPQRF